MLQKVILLILITILTTYSLSIAEEIFPDLLGEELLEALVDAYKPNYVLSYGDARDVLYGEIYNENNYLTGVYTGYTIYMNPNEDPSEWAYDHGINCEHTWPQSKGAIGNAKSDMHHLYPTRIQANSARGSDPFAESNDNQTDALIAAVNGKKDILSSSVMKNKSSKAKAVRLTLDVDDSEEKQANKKNVDNDKKEINK